MRAPKRACGVWFLIAPSSASTSRPIHRPGSSRLGQSLSRDLGAPGGDTLLGHVRLVVLIEWKSAELSVDDRLRLGEVVSVGGDGSDHLGSGLLHGGVDLLDGVAEVVSVGRGVSAAEDGNLLAAEVEVLDLIDDLVPGGSAPSLVGSGVPGWRTDNESRVSGEVIHVDLANVSRVADVSLELLGDPVGGSLGVSRGGGVEESNLGPGSHPDGSGSPARGLNREAGSGEGGLGQHSGLHRSVC
mmetsp:Transcript_10730/g.32781  ORF Transcript_10730/g.32781 Transcript_10730/m.32781 type:complete len:243 (-) Transcript_10730:117-845(-)